MTRGKHTSRSHQLPGKQRYPALLLYHYYRQQKVPAIRFMDWPQGNGHYYSDVLVRRAHDADHAYSL